MTRHEYWLVEIRDSETNRTDIVRQIGTNKRDAIKKAERYAYRNGGFKNPVVTNTTFEDYAAP